ncbi:MAG: hypothetical protein LUD53_06045 [Clostridiales bacterium]|nr:hypothetical protein [Clostridiales bacterium]
MNRNLSFEQRVENILATYEIERKYCEHAFYHNEDNDHLEMDRLWAKNRPDISWSHSFGRERGPERQFYDNVTLGDARAALVYLSLFDIMPEIGGQKNIRALFNGQVHTICTDIIEIGDDGRTARACFLTPGIAFGALKPSSMKNSRVYSERKEKTKYDLKRYSVVIWERYGTDFIKQNGEWRFLHSIVRPDIFGPFDGQNPAYDRYLMVRDNPEALTVHGGDFDASPEGIADLVVLLDEQETMHHEWNPVQTVQEAAVFPKPFYTLDRENTYDPGGFDILDEYIEQHPEEEERLRNWG